MGLVNLAAEQFYRLSVAAAAGEQIGEEEFVMLLARAGRVEGPALLWQAWEDEVITQPTLTASAGPVWSDAEYPLRELEDWQWHQLFRSAGFTIDGQPRRRLRASRRLYRGATAEGRHGWSWTDRLATAEFYATDYFKRDRGQVWTVLAPAALILAVIHGRDEAEYVVDPTGLDVRRLARADGIPAAERTGRSA